MATGTWLVRNSGRRDGFRAARSRQFVCVVLVAAVISASATGTCGASGQTGFDSPISHATDPADSIAAKRVGIESETASVREQAAELSERQQSLEEKIGLLGLNEGNRILLAEYGRTLPAVTASQQRIAWAGAEMRLTSLEVQRLAKTVVVPNAGVAREPAGALPLDSGAAPSSADAESTAQIEQLQQYALALGLLASEHNHLLDRIESMRGFIDRQLLWVPSAGPMGPGDFVRVVDGALVLARPRPWIELGQRMLGKFLAEPWQLLVVIGLVVGSGWLTRKLDKLSRGRAAGREGPADSPTAGEAS